MKMSEPTFSTLVVLGINAYTTRHHDQTDVRSGLAGLVALGDYIGGDLCFPQLALQLPHQAGDCVLFRGAELDHYVADWTGYRIFLQYTNHQPVRNYAHRVIGRRPAKPNDPWHPDRRAEESGAVPLPLQPSSTTDSRTGAYSPCFMEPIPPEPEALTRDELWGAATDPSDASCQSDPSDAESW
ncbi:hypothetical protein F4778DRAFT_454180 [Xylariomycetidae sp. FL2044]|nr:hypothetical protein F4778DRAFT_454180 [Xylariomycetidae sp. FL2044]